MVNIKVENKKIGENWPMLATYCGTFIYSNHPRVTHGFPDHDVTSRDQASPSADDRTSHCVSRDYSSTENSQWRLEFIQLKRSSMKQTIKLIV